ncbi:MAG: hypothetical protein MUF64_00660 [Polyangiaceae bacterium]|jgi:hypothetical protein|nr:hypothetical protein [Polyangiaceae bacterium]
MVRTLFPSLAGLLPLVMFLLVGCGRSPPRGEVKRIETYHLQLETPAGWTGGGAGGIYEFHSPDGTGRVRIAALEGASSAVGLKDAQWMAGTGATIHKRLLPTSPVKIGALVGERTRVAASDRRVYEIIALSVTLGERKAVVLIQTSVSAEHAEKDPAAVDALFTSLRQSIQASGATSGPG